MSGGDSSQEHLDGLVQGEVGGGITSYLLFF